MKKTLKFLSGLFLFILYVSPVLYGLSFNIERWIEAGTLWLVFGWLPLIYLGYFMGFDEL